MKCHGYWGSTRIGPRRCPSVARNVPDVDATSFPCRYCAEYLYSPEAGGMKRTRNTAPFSASQNPSTSQRCLPFIDSKCPVSEASVKGFRGRGPFIFASISTKSYASTVLAVGENETP